MLSATAAGEVPGTAGDCCTREASSSSHPAPSPSADVESRNPLDGGPEQGPVAGAAAAVVASASAEAKGTLTGEGRGPERSSQTPPPVPLPPAIARDPSDAVRLCPGVMALIAARAPIAPHASACPLAQGHNEGPAAPLVARWQGPKGTGGVPLRPTQKSSSLAASGSAAPSAWAPMASTSAGPHLAAPDSPSAPLAPEAGIAGGAPAVDADYDTSRQYSLRLGNIRDALIRHEDSIIFALIERAQFKRNAPAYCASASQGAVAVPGFQGSLLEYVMRETEALHGKVRRYTSPTERPYFPDAIPPLILPPLAYPKVLHSAASGININPVVWKMYFEELLPAIADPGDDFNYGSAVTSDVICLQALSKRIHYGVFVAEAKFLESPQTFVPLIEAQDAEAILEHLTKPDVEAAVLRRVEAKAAAFGQDIETPSPAPVSASGSSAEDGAAVAHAGSVGEQGRGGLSTQGEKRFKVAPAVVAELYGRWIMPLTKQVQVDYLLRRLDAE